MNPSFNRRNFLRNSALAGTALALAGDTVSGPGVLDVAIWKQASSLTVHLVNLTRPMMMKGPLREFLPTPPQKVSIRMLPGTKVKKVQLLVSAVTPRVQESKGIVSLTIPSILDHEVIAIGL